MTDNEHADQEAHDIELDEAVQHAEDADHFSDQPPVDDFEDEATASVEEHTDEEAHHEQVTEGDAAPQPKKSGKVVFLGAIAGVVILVGGLVYTQFFAGGSAPAPAPTHAQPANTQTADSKPVVVPPGAAVAPAPAANTTPPKADDISNLKQIETAQTENQQVALTGVQGDKPVDVMGTHVDPALAAGVSGNQQMKGIVTIPALPPSATPASLPPSLAAPATPDVPAAPVAAANTATTAPTVPSIPNIPVAAAPVAVPSVPAKPTLIAPPTAPSTLPGMTTSVSQPVTAPAVQPVAAAPVTDKEAQARIAALTSQVSTLQQSLDQALDKLNHVSASLPAAGEPPLKAGTVSVTTGYSDATAARPHHKTTHTAVAHKHAAKTLHKQTAAKTAAVKAQHWVLRAAVPGEAWIATSADTPDLRHVKVGDSVSGLGQITAITSTGMGWIVQGTQGSAE